MLFRSDEDDDDVFVTADPIRGQHVTVKSAIISTTNPYCTSARMPKNRRNGQNIIAKCNKSWVETSAPSPSSDSSDSSLALSSSSSTSSHSPHANNNSTSASILSHDQVKKICITSIMHFD